MGEQLELNVVSIEEITGKFGKQLQIDGTFPAKNGWRGRVWIKYYPVPAPNQHLGKLCLAIQRVTGQQFSSLDAAINAIRSYGRIFLRVSGFNTVAGKVNPDGTLIQYPKFQVYPEVLPGEGTQPQTQQQAPLKASAVFLEGLAPANMKGTPQERLIAFIRNHVDLIGKPLDDTLWNQIYENELMDDGPVSNLLRDGGYLQLDQQTSKPVIAEKARELIG